MIAVPNELVGGGSENFSDVQCFTQLGDIRSNLQKEMKNEK